jgi:hypothetical protein
MRPARALILSALLSGIAPAVLAQTAPAPAGGPAPGFLTRYDFHLGIALLGEDDQRFSWDARFGGDFDVLDYGRGRITLVGDYQVLLGDEFRAFDPNQSIYILEVQASYRMERGEAAAVFHHTSRHLSDRPKRFPIDWNMLGVQYGYSTDVRGMRFDGRSRLLGTVARSFVDYRWRFEAGGTLTRDLRGRLQAMADAELTGIGVAGRVHDRGGQLGGRIEGGIRIEGEQAALELFVAVERRIDADPIDLQPRAWTLAGFRVVPR